MNLTSTLDSISQRLDERRAGNWSEYRKLVALVCDGKEQACKKSYPRSLRGLAS